MIVIINGLESLARRRHHHSGVGSFGRRPGEAESTAVQPGTSSGVQANHSEGTIDNDRNKIMYSINALWRASAIPKE